MNQYSKLGTLAILILLGAAVASADTGALLTIDAYQNGTTVVTDISRQPMTDEPRHLANPDLAVLGLHESGTYQYQTNLSFRRRIPQLDGPVVQDPLTIQVSVPLQEGQTEIIVLRDGERVATVTDEELSSVICTVDGVCPAYCSGRGVDRDCTCGNGVCDPQTENVTTCLQDCAEATNQTTELVNDSGGTDRENQEPQRLPLLPVGILLLSAVAIAAGYLYMRRRNEEEDAVYSDMPERY